uniref:Si:busm1-57f23.1 n=1 Tax=Scleropages formosus TaxID=113540 RepID=A0A8C9TDM6_SCLFO
MAPLCALLLLCLLSAAPLSRSQQPEEEALIQAEYVQPLGGWVAMNPQSPEVQEAAEMAVQVFNSRSKAKKLFRLHHVTSVSKQVTNVISYKIDARIGKTKCMKSEANDTESCAFGKKYHLCKFEVTLDPRHDIRKVISSECRKEPRQ